MAHVGGGGRYMGSDPMTERATHTLDDALQAAALRLAQDGESPDDILREFERVQSKDVSKLTMQEWFSRFAYVVTADAFFDMKTRHFLQRRAFDALFRHLKTVSVHDGKPIRPSNAFDENRQAMGGFLVDNVTYAPGLGSLLARDGIATANIWRDARPPSTPGDAEPWLAHARSLFPPELLEHVLNVLAFKVQNPSVKVNHGLMLSGVPGCGKDSFIAPFLWAVGGIDHRNIVTVRNEEILGGQPFNYAIESEVMVVNELRVVNQNASRIVENFLKPVLAAPPELLTVNKKHEHPHMALNRMLVLAFSNEKRPIGLPAGDRRWFVHWTDAPRMPERTATALWEWYHGPGFPVVAHWLANRDVSAFNPAAAPPMTPSKAALLLEDEQDIAGAVQRMVRNQSPPFDRGVVASPWAGLCRLVERELLAVGVRGTVTESVLHESLRESGWLNRGPVAAGGLPRRSAWVMPGAPCASATDSELRRTVETLWPGLSAVKQG